MQNFSVQHHLEKGPLPDDVLKALDEIRKIDRKAIWTWNKQVISAMRHSSKGRR